MSAEKIALGWTRDEIVDRFARIIRNKLGPDFWEAPPPEWATEAAETIWQNVEAIVRDRLETDRADIERLKAQPQTPDPELRAAVGRLETNVAERARLGHGGWTAGYLAALDDVRALTSRQPGSRVCATCGIQEDSHYYDLPVFEHPFRLAPQEGSDG